LFGFSIKEFILSVAANYAANAIGPVDMIGYAFALITVLVLINNWLRNRPAWRQARMVFGILVTLIGCGIGAFGLSIVAAGEKSSKTSETKPSVFRYEKGAFVESRLVKWSDGSHSELHETNYYLPIWHSLDTGQQLKSVKARIFMIGHEPIAARVKETGEFSVNLRHGEVALFKIGRVVSMDDEFVSGSVTFDDEEKRKYQHYRKEHGKHFEVFSESGAAFGIGDARPAPAPETRWFNIVISADDVVSLSISVFLDFYGKRLIRFADTNQEDAKNDQ
jgi:hypothetical protein